LVAAVEIGRQPAEPAAKVAEQFLPEPVQMEQIVISQMVVQAEQQAVVDLTLRVAAVAVLEMGQAEQVDSRAQETMEQAVEVVAVEVVHQLGPTQEWVVQEPMAI
jgi:hypothetical protein